MIPVVTPTEMQAAEATAVKAGYPERSMMQRAAEQIAAWIADHVTPNGATATAVGLIGPGNNGGDGLVTLGLLAGQGWDVATIFLGRDEIGDVPVEEKAKEILEAQTGLEMLEQADVILDGVLGFQSRPQLPDDWAHVFETVAQAARAHQTPIIAIDVPSGIDAESGESAPNALRADYTIAIQFPKIGCLREPAASKAGEIIVLDIGIDEPRDFSEPRMLSAGDARRLLPTRPAWSHKTAVGGLLIIGGAPGYYGAPRLSGEAALRVGAGYVGLAVPRSIIAPIASAVPELIYHPLSDGDGRRAAELVRETLVETGDRYRCLLIGPGLGRDEVADDFLSSLVGTSSEVAPASERLAFGIPRHARGAGDGDAESILVNRRAVIDADGLNWLAKQPDWPSLLPKRSCILTPHAGEMARLLGADSTDQVLANPFSVAREAAAQWKQVVVLKAGHTCVAEPDGQVMLAQRATPELATAGSGDVLSGIIASLVAQGLDPYDAACLAVYLGAEAGRRLRSQVGLYSVIARDVINMLPQILRDLSAARVTSI